MSIDWERAGLLEDVDGDRRERRIELLGELERLGAPESEIREAAQDGRLSLLVVERALGGQERLTAREVAERSGGDLEFLMSLQQAMGRAIPDSDEPAFDERDVEAAELLGRIRASGMPDEGLLEIARVLGRSLSQGADAIRGVFERAFVDEGAPEEDFALRNAGVAGELQELNGPLLSYILGVHLREGIRSEAVGAAARAASGELAGARTVAVGFVDLVGYTRLGQHVDADAVGEVALRLEALATEVVRGSARVVKTIGDAVMLVGTDPGDLLEVVVGLVARVGEEEEKLPEAHAGVAHGAALPRGGDWYGHPVNLASRITGVARAGAVLADDALRDAVGEDDARFRWSPAGSRRLKGVRGSVRMWRVRAAG